MKFQYSTAAIFLATLTSSVNGFAPINSSTRSITNFNNDMNTALHMAEGKKKRRRRKKSPAPSSDVIPGMDGPSSDNPPSIDELKSIANFTPSQKAQQSSTDLNAAVPSTNLSPVGDGLLEQNQDNTLVELPDIRDALKAKELKKMEEEVAEMKARPKIDRKDRKAMLQLLEEQPYADADDSYFLEEEYGTVSALLGEGAKPFLGIPPGPLQVGHFIGALGIILCAFVEYPGFPLTNLPTPLRDALQGGLFTIYLVNAGLAVLATFKAAERGQSAGLWAVKTFSVGGLALDQLTQLPTLKQVEEMENRKGARALKKNRK